MYVFYWHMKTENRYSYRDFITSCNTESKIQNCKMLDGFFNWPKNIVLQSILVMVTVNNYHDGNEPCVFVSMKPYHALHFLLFSVARSNKSPVVIAMWYNHHHIHLCHMVELLVTIHNYLTCTRNGVSYCKWHELQSHNYTFYQWVINILIMCNP